MVDISTWCCDHLKGLHNYWRYLKQVSGFGGRRGPAETSACAHGAVLQRGGWPMLGGCVQQTARLLSFLQSAAERHGGGVKPAQPWLREQAALLLLLGSAVSAHTSTAAMLKFFSGRDDENESLLEAVTEGKSWGQRGTDASLLDYLLQDDSAGLCWLSRKRWYSIYLCAQTASAETRALTRFLRLPGGDQWVPPPHPKVCVLAGVLCRDVRLSVALPPASISTSRLNICTCDGCVTVPGSERSSQLHPWCRAACLGNMKRHR